MTIDNVNIYGNEYYGFPGSLELDELSTLVDQKL